MKLLMENWRRFLNEREGSIHIFFDMDGVLVDFSGKLSEEINKTLHEDPEEFYSGSKSKRRALKRLQAAFKEEGRVNPVTAEELEDIISKKDAKEERTKIEKRINDYLFSLVVNNPQIWIDMKVLPGAEGMVSLAEKIGNAYILTSPVDESSGEAKRQWLSTHFPDIPSDKIFVTGEKGEALQSLGIIDKGETAILIDDRSKYIDQFEGAGGIGVPHSSKRIEKTINFLRNLMT